MTSGSTDERRIVQRILNESSSEAWHSEFDRLLD